jgi:arylsulfatase
MLMLGVACREQEEGMVRRVALGLLVVALAASRTVVAAAAEIGGAANIVLIVADDLGYGDLGCYGAKEITTPNIDRLAAEGVRFTNFHVAQPVCSASRAALLTGCYPNRIGILGALGPNSAHGIAASETTLAELLKSRGYATAAVGKWHLGHRALFLPTRHGFDQYFGVPYSNDMWPRHPEAKPGTYPPLPLFDGDKVVDADLSSADQATLTARYTERAVRFITQHEAEPFFLYLAYNAAHVPLYPGERFKGCSKQGAYGDVVQEIDWSVGEVLKAIAVVGAGRDTLIMFTSDNGPWLSYGNHAGSAGPLREGKGTVWEGGVRVPFIARWPGVIPAGAVQSEPAMTIDVLPTVAKLAQADVPKMPIDGRDIGPLLRCEERAKSPHLAYYFYYGENELRAVRSGRWKLVFPHTYQTMAGQAPGKDGKPGRYKEAKAGLELYDLSVDMGEATDVAAQNPEVARRLQALAESARADLGDGLTKQTGAGVREPGRLR